MEIKNNELLYIQQNLNAPKKQYNAFGKYNYRSCEDILEAVKPLLQEVKCTLKMSDEIIQVGNWIYVKATAILTTSSGATHTATAFAREPESKKGMDESQITGSASSYARKYALNGLFCIDDNKDVDATKQLSVAKVSKEELEKVFKSILPTIESAPTVQKLYDLHAQNAMLHNYKPYKDAMNKRNDELNGTKK